MLKRLGKRAQTTAEYAIVIALIVGAVVAMQVYVKRGLQGRMRDAVDHTGAGADVGGEVLSLSGDQYEPYYLSSGASTTQQGTNEEDLKEGGSVGRTATTTTDAERAQTIGW